MTTLAASILASLMAVVGPATSRQESSTGSRLESGGDSTYEPGEALELVLFALRDGSREDARAMLAEVVSTLAEPLPGEESAYVAGVLELERQARDLGNLSDSRRLWECVLEIRQRILPPEHRDLLEAKQGLAMARLALGDPAGALDLLEEVLEVRTRLFPPDHPDLLDTRQNVAGTRMALGDLAGAHETFEAVVAARMRLLPSDDPNLLRAKLGLALARKKLGDFAGARELEEEVLAVRARSLSPDHPEILSVKQNLVATRAGLGDFAGASLLAEAVHETRSRLLPPDNPDLLDSKQDLATTRYALGDIDGAHEMLEAVVAARTRLLASDHPDLLGAMVSLAVTRKALGDVAGARELEEAVLAARAHLPPDHPDLLAAKLNLAATRSDLGDLDGARELEEQVLAARLRLLSPDHPHLLMAQGNLAVTRTALGDLAEARELFSSMLAGMRKYAAVLRAEAARPAREAARIELHRLATALVWGGRADPEHTLEPELFATLESLRLVSVASPEAAQALAARPELAREARALAQIRSQLDDLASSGPRDPAAAEEWRTRLVSFTEQRDRAERALRAKLAAAGAFVGEIDPVTVGARLAPDAVAVSFLRYTQRFEPDPETRARPPSVDSLLAFVVQPDGAVRRVELGPAAELESLVQSWRRSLGTPLERGIAAAADEESAEAEIGRALRERVLDPVLEAAGPAVRELHVVLDDLLFLVPLDALPLADQARVGERLSIHVESTLARLVREKRPAMAHGTLVALGGIDFDAEEKSAEEDPRTEDEPESNVPAVLLEASSPPLDRASRPLAFEPLRQTRYEIEDIGAQCAEAFGEQPLLLSGGAATKTALWAAAPRARFLHVATHGWFASESFRSQLDAPPEVSSTLSGFAPETLCGLALAGANRGQDALGRVPGILTAEELASFDLRNCELAVLSACETNVGIRRAGQGIQSLQTALHAAGARTAITSLWKVDDAATRRLFEVFYTKLWKEKLGKADALWQAKMALRAEGHPPRDWAAWVLSGDPN